MLKIAYAILYTRDIVRIGAFYREALGLNEAFGDHRFIAFQVGDALLGIKVSEEEREVPGHQTVILGTDAVEELYKKFCSDGLTICKPLTTEDWGVTFALLDPDSNKVEYVQESW